MNEFLITLDVDWAPDFTCEAVAAELSSAGVRATWFVTHEGRYLDSLRTRPDLHELGIHPNFLRGSTQGADPSSVLDHVLGVVPEARAARSHGLMQWGDLFELLIDRGLEVDSSTFLPGSPGITPVRQWRGGRSLLRVPFYFAEDHELEKPMPDWSLSRHLDVAGLKVFMFHPLHLYLNTQDLGVYAALKSRTTDLRTASRAVVDEHIAEGDGPRSLFRELLSELVRRGGGKRLADLAISSARRD